MVNIKNKIRILCLVLMGLYSSYFFVLSTLSPICAHFEFYDLSAKLTSLFMYSCHQQPDRSFWILNYPVPLCARCYGVYLATMFFGLFCAFKELRINKYIIGALVCVVLLDIMLNMGIVFPVVNTGNIIRFLVGNIIGFLIIIGINNIFKIKRREKTCT